MFNKYYKIQINKKRFDELYLEYEKIFCTSSSKKNDVNSLNTFSIKETINHAKHEFSSIDDSDQYRLELDKRLNIKKILSIINFFLWGFANYKNIKGSISGSPPLA